MPGTPTAATTIAARRVYAAQSGTPVCTTVTAAFAVGRFWVSSSASGRPERGAAAEDADLLAGDLDAVVGEQRLDAGGRARDRPGMPSASRPMLTGCSPSTSLSGSISSSAASKSICFGVGCCTSIASTAGSSFIDRIAATRSAWLASSGRCTWGLVIPSSSALAIFIAT
jgi:hypothetical protein